MKKEKVFFKNSGTCASVSGKKLQIYKALFRFPAKSVWISLSLLIFFFIAALPLFPQNDPPVDSLYLLLKTAKEDTQKVDLLISLSNKFRNTDLEKSSGYAGQAKQLSEKIHYLKGIGQSLSALGVLKLFSGDYDSAMVYYESSLDNFSKAGDKKGTGNVYLHLGVLYRKKENYDTAFSYYSKAVGIFSEIKDDKGLASCYTNMGVILDKEGKYSEAIEQHLKALKIFDNLGNLNGSASCLLNIGAIEYLRQNFIVALDYFLKSSELFEKINDQKNLIMVWENIAAIFYQQEKYEMALKYYLQSLEFRKSMGLNRDLASSYNNIGETFTQLKKYDEAISSHGKALDASTRLNDKWGMVYAHSGLGLAYTNTNNLQNAVMHLKKGIEIAAELNARRELQIMYERIASAYQLKNDYKNAYTYILLLTSVQDSLFGEESARQIAEMQTKYESEKKQKEIELLQKDKKLQDTELEIKEAEVKKQNTQKIAFGAGLLLVSALALVIFRGYSNKRKLNRLLTQQKSEIEDKNIFLEKANTEISNQKTEIQEKNNEILSSIRYARRIQEAILPPEKMIKQGLPESFVLYKPKDIVAGDFYWMHSLPAGGESHARGSDPDREIVFIAAADCTGHGVPGAFVSIVGHNALNRAVKEFGLAKPSAILDKVNELVEETFSKSGGEMKDGMDIALCSFDFKEQAGAGASPPAMNERGRVMLQYAGANNSVYCIRKGELMAGLPEGAHPPADKKTEFRLCEVKADKQPIGNFFGRKPFTNHEIELQPGDAVYIFSDGYADQFGGPKGKKFKYSQFENILISIQDKSMEQQKEILNETIEKWKAWPDQNGASRNLEQVDDICIIGVRI